MTITKQNFIIFSSIDWTTHWQLHHQLATSLVSTGNRVLFIENTGVRSANIGDIGRLSERISNWRKGLHGFSSIDGDNLTSYSPILLPFPYSKLLLLFNKKIFNFSISRWMKASNFSNPVIISFLPTPLIQSAINSINPKLTVYYCANNMAESSLSASQVRPYEDHFFESVDVVFTAAYVIQEYAQRFSEKVFYFPPGIDFDKFNIALKDNKDIPSDLKKISGRIVGYIGALGRVLDQELLCALADQCSDFTFVFIGPKYTNINVLEAKSNIVFLGAKPHNQLPYYIKGFDVGIVPYICNDFTEGVYPSKLNEYLAMGIPAVSTNLREVRESKEVYGEAAIIANNTEEFINSVKSLVLEKDDVLRKEKRIKIAKENSWESRFKGISDIIREEIVSLEKQPIEINWKDRFNSYFNLRSKRRRLVFTTIFGLLIIFYSPLFWFMGEQLIARDFPKKSDAIVVFSGDGEVSYQNLSYQNRALDAIGLYKEGYADKIFLSSGREQTIADVEMIKLYLVSKGVSDLSIHILEKYPNSTYQNVIMVKESLEKNDIKSILFTTSPYHSRRAVLTWEKSAPNIEVVSFNEKSTLNRGVEWNMGLDKIRVIAYEYVAIVHNWINGRI
jgi:uncharacterized SAM-binding protein YcdF (DUF218 family)/glycosyltransferase involved in cell wall biosynthesis